MRLATRLVLVAVATATLAAASIPGAVAKPPVDVRERASVAGRAQSAQSVIVTYQAGADRAQTVSRTARSLGSPVREGRTLATGAQVVSATGVSADALARELRKRTDVASAVPNRRLFSTATPNDPYYGYQWDLKTSVPGLNVAGAWTKATGSGQRVAVLDTGITAHPDLRGQYVGGYDFISDAPYARDGNGRDSNPADTGDYLTGTASDLECYDPDFPERVDSSWHGTHVAGTIAALSDNSQGVSGVAPRAKVVPVRVLGLCGGLESDIIDAIVWAAGGSVKGVPANRYPARVLNLSLGIYGTCSAPMQKAVNAARSKGALVVAAAGNDGINVADFSPASCSGVVAVGAVGPNGARASYSNYGSKITLMGQGGDLDSGRFQDGIISTVNNGTTKPTSSYGYSSWDGTSMAAPHVAAVAALARSYDNSLTPTQLRNLLIAGTEKMPASCPQGCGAGIIDAAKTISRHPKVSAVSAKSGRLSGGKRVAISGSSLDGATKVTFGGRAGTRLVYNKTNKMLYVTTPRGAKKAKVLVTVHSPRGNTKTSSGSHYTYT